MNELDDLDELEQLLTSDTHQMRFRNRPDPVPADLRLPWRFAALTLVLTRCRGEAAGMEQLHLLLTAIRSPLIQQVLLRSLAGAARPNDVLIRNDPALARTIKIADASGLVTIKSNGTVKLTARGRDLAKIVAEQPDALAREKQFLDRLPAKITQKSFRDILERA